VKFDKEIWKPDELGETALLQGDTSATKAAAPAPGHATHATSQEATSSRTLWWDDRLWLGLQAKAAIACIRSNWTACRRGVAVQVGSFRFQLGQCLNPCCHFSEGRGNEPKGLHGQALTMGA
jgi:hypothetical protein